jgi:hypothetical protein
MRLANVRSSPKGWSDNPFTMADRHIVLPEDGVYFFRLPTKTGTEILSEKFAKDMTVGVAISILTSTHAW